MSVFCENEGRMVTIVVPGRVARGCQVKVQQCHKPYHDADCNWCLAKYSCAVFPDEPEFSLALYVKQRKQRRKH